MARGGRAGDRREARLSGRHHDRAAARGAARPARSPRRAEFFSFGTNDLTQTTFGISRDDAGELPRRLHRARASSRTIRSSPSTSEGVGELVAHRRRARPQGARRTSSSASAASMAAIRPRSPSATRSGSTTCPARPIRVPIARLAAAQAALGKRSAQDGMSLDALRGGGKRALATALAGWSERSRQRRARNACSTRPGGAAGACRRASPARPASASRRSARRWSQRWREERQDRRRDRGRSRRRKAQRRRAARRPRAHRPPIRATRAVFVRSMAARDRLGGLADQTLRRDGADARAVRPSC